MQQEDTGNWAVVIYRVVTSGYFLPLCLILAFLVRLFWILAVPADPVEDCKAYYDGGLDIANGNGYVNHEVPTAYWPVGYPLLLAGIFTLFGQSLFVAKFTNVVLYTGTIILSYYVAKKEFGSEIAGRITAFILSLYPTHITYMSLLTADNIVLFFIMLGLVFLMIDRHKIFLSIASGLVFGFATLVKAQVIFLPLLFFILYSRRNIRNIRNKTLRIYTVRFVLVYVFLFICLLPWFVRNYSVFKHFPVISTNGGINLLIGNNPYATGGYFWEENVRSLIGDYSGEFDRNQKAKNIAVNYIINHPIQIKLWWNKLENLYASDWVGVRWNVGGLRGKHYNVVTYYSLFVVYYAGPIIYKIIFVGFLVSVIVVLFMYVYGKYFKKFPALSLWVIIYFTIISLVFFGEPRFHFPLVPWMVMYIGGVAEFILRPSEGGHTEGVENSTSRFPFTMMSV